MFKVFKATESELFNRDGSPNTRPYAISPKGKPWTSYVSKCGRCGGLGGSEAWKFTGYTCYDCGGSGKGPVRYLTLYTCEELAKLNATKAKRDATKQAKRDAAAAKAQAEADARRAEFMTNNAALIARMRTHADKSEFIADVLERGLAKAYFSEGQVVAVIASMDKTDERNAQRAASTHVGTVGERINVKVKVARATSFTRPGFVAHWTTETVHVITMRDEAGNTFVTMGSFQAEEGEEFTVRGTVKAHDVYNGEKQTKLSRVTVPAEKPKKVKA